MGTLVFKMFSDSITISPSTHKMLDIDIQTKPKEVESAERIT